MLKVPQSSSLQILLVMRVMVIKEARREEGARFEEEGDPRAPCYTIRYRLWFSCPGMSDAFCILHHVAATPCTGTSLIYNKAMLGVDREST